MTLDSTKDILFLVLAIASAGVAVFLCWALYEVARMLHQVNDVVEDARDKMNRLERAFVSIKEKLELSAGALKAITSFLHSREEKTERKRK